MQSSHAALEIPSEKINKIGEHPHLVLCEVDDLVSLEKMADTAEEHGVSIYRWHESDIGGDLSAFATEPVDKAGRKCFQQLKLLGKDPVKTNENDLLNKLNKELSEQMEHLNKVNHLVQEFPDLTEQTSRWRTVRYCSSYVNKMADYVEIKHNCGCCADSPLEVYPFTVVHEQRVYSIPQRFIVGHKNDFGVGEEPHSDWPDQLRENNISEKVIHKVQDYFEQNPPEYFDPDEDEDIDF